MTTSSHAECQFMLKARSQLRVAACNALRAVIHEHRPAGSPGFFAWQGEAGFLPRGTLGRAKYKTRRDADGWAARDRTTALRFRANRGIEKGQLPRW
jgi:hypothetical protein